jgi:hypothetical protein
MADDSSDTQGSPQQGSPPADAGGAPPIAGEGSQPTGGQPPIAGEGTTYTTKGANPVDAETTTPVLGGGGIERVTQVREGEVPPEPTRSIELDE